MQKLFSIITFCFLLFANKLHAQQVRFNRVLKSGLRGFADIVQDKQGFIWVSAFDKGLQRYDGINLKAYTNDQRNPNSIANGPIISLHVDADNTMWVGMLGGGLDKFDPVA